MKKLIFIFAALIGLNSCTEWLDIRPESEVVLEDFWQTEDQAQAVLASAYRGLTLDATMDKLLVWGELRSDNVVSGNSITLDMLRILNVNITPTNSYANWGDFYSVINYCNTFLYYAPDVINRDQNFTESKLHTMESEALAIRAFCYFYLVRTFKEVPLVLEPSIDDLQDYEVGKSTEREVLDQIISDLQQSLLYVREDYGKGAYNKGRFTKSAVNALLADVYLWDNQFQNCINACDEVIANPSLKLVEGEKVLSEVFYTGNSTESIFELQFDKDIQHNNAVNNFYGVSESQNGLWSIPKFLTSEHTHPGEKSEYSPFVYAASSIPESSDDIREYHSYGMKNNGEGYFIFKYALAQCTENADGSYTPTYRSAAKTVNWIVYRLSDLILMKAEALVQLGSTQNRTDALKLVNETYLRSNKTADSLQIGNYPDQGSMEKLVLRERQREFLFEGKRWFDLLRMVRRKNEPAAILAYLGPKLSGDNMQMKKLSVMDGLFMPVLKSELDINPNLTQNPFYEDENFMN